MKKIITTLMLFIMLFSICTNVQATEEKTSEETTENLVIQQIQDEKIQARAKVINAGKSYEKEEAEGIKRTLQDVTIEIKDGKYKGQK